MVFPCFTVFGFPLVVKLWRTCDVIIVGTKPDQVSVALTSACAVVESGEESLRKLLISMAAGVSCSALEEFVPASTRIVRVMPNLACTIGYGCTMIALGRGAATEDEEFVLQMFATLGETFLLPEKNMVCSIVHLFFLFSSRGSSLLGFLRLEFDTLSVWQP